MSRLTEQLGLAVFTVLTGALATNMFLLQPPAHRGVTGPEERMGSFRQEGPSIAAVEPPKMPEGTPSVSVAATPTVTPELPVTPAVAELQLPAEPVVAKSETTVAPSEQNPLKVSPPVVSAPPVTANPDLIKAVQRELRAQGYETGAEDGSMSLVTRAAIMAYEADQSLPLTAEPTDALLQKIVLGDVGGASKNGTPTADMSPAASYVVREIQTELRRTGYDPGSDEGRLSDATIRAIREFETAEHMTPKGRISGELLAKLKAAPEKKAGR